LPGHVRGATLAMSFYYFAYFAYVGAYSPYITLYLKDIGLAATQIGVLYSIPQVMRIFGPNVWGALAERSGATNTILRLAAVLAMCAMCAAYLGTSFQWMFAVLVAMHFFTSAQMPLLEAITLNHVRDAPGNYGRIRVWGSVGFILAVLGLGRLLDFLSTRAVLHVTAGLLALTVLAAWLVPAVARRHHTEVPQPVSRILARQEVRAFLATGAMNAFAHAALYTFYSIHLADHGYSKGVIGVMWALGVVIEIAVFQYMPQLTRRFDLATLYYSTFAVCAVRFLIIAWAVDQAWLLILAQLMHASTFAIYHASAVGLVGRYFGAQHQARGQALYISLSFGVGGFAGGIVSGLAWDRLGPAWTFSMSAAAGALGMAILSAWGQRGAAPPR
jgi:PPP family 3-phenylpropionic acid transporter